MVTGGFRVLASRAADESGATAPVCAATTRAGSDDVEIARLTCGDACQPGDHDRIRAAANAIHR